MLDTSFHGDMEGWRNERLCSEETGWQHIDHNIEEKDATTGGLSSGLLEFDFVSLAPMHRAINSPSMPSTTDCEKEV